MGKYNNYTPKIMNLLTVKGILAKKQEKELNEQISDISERIGNATGEERTRLESQYDLLAQQRKKLSDEKFRVRHLKDL